MKRKYFRTRFERRRFHDEVQKHDEARFPSLNTIIRTFREFGERHPYAAYTDDGLKNLVRRYVKERCSCY